jgi:sugar-specific transcriptional regulator TrmB
MTQNNFINLFTEIGLTERESKVYTTLLSKRMFTASELQIAADIPRTKIYEVLQKMINKGICIEKRIGRNKFFEAIEPSVALKKLIEDFKNEMSRKEKVAKKIVDIFTPIYEKGKVKENPLDYIEVFKNKNQIHKKYISLVNKTQHEILTFNKAPYACNDEVTLREQVDAETNLIERGAVSKGLYEQEELLEDEVFKETELKLTKKGHKGKVIESLPVKMILFDRKVVMFALDEPVAADDSLTMIVIEHKSLAKACKILFDHLWDSSEDISYYKKSKSNEFTIA